MANVLLFWKKARSLQFSAKRLLLKIKSTWNSNQWNPIQKLQHKFQRITSTKCTEQKRSKFKTQKFLRRTNSENFRSTGQILPKISYLKGKITPFEKTSFQFIVTKILRIKLHYFKIQIPVRTKIRNSKSLQNLMCNPALSFKLSF